MASTAKYNREVQTNAYLGICGRTLHYLDDTRCYGIRSVKYAPTYWGESNPNKNDYDYDDNNNTAEVMWSRIDGLNTAIAMVIVEDANHIITKFPCFGSSCAPNSMLVMATVFVIP